MLGLDALVEQRIQEAIARGEFEALEGAGRPLAIEDDPLIPEDQRLAYRILKNAGFVPPEVEQLRQIGDLERFIDRAADDAERSKAITRLSLLRTYLAARCGCNRALDDRRYTQQLLGRLDRDHNR